MVGLMCGWWMDLELELKRCRIDLLDVRGRFMNEIEKL